MRYAIIGDIHANLAALEAVLEDIKNQGEVEKIWCLGDIVGYGPDPHECIELLCQTNHICVAGNHDWAAIGKAETTDFNPDAAAACQWTARVLAGMEACSTKLITENHGDCSQILELLRSLCRCLKQDSIVGFNAVYISNRFGASSVAVW